MNDVTEIQDQLKVEIDCKYYEPNEYNDLITNLLTKNHNNNFSYFHLNCQGLSAKWQTLTQLFSDLNDVNSNFDFICLSEIFHHEHDQRLHLDGYLPLISKTRAHPSRGGGVGIFVRECFNVKARPDLSLFIPNLFESLFIECEIENVKEIIGVVYRPNTPPLANVDSFTTYLHEIMEMINQERCKCTIMGDINVDLLKSPFDNKISAYVDSLYAHGFTPVISLPTRVFGQSSSLIDHIYTNKFEAHVLSGVVITDISDHYAVFYIDQSRCKPQNKLESFRRSYSNRNVSNFINILECMSFDAVTRENDCQKAYDIFQCKVEYAHNVSFPLQKLTKKQNRYSPWITPAIIHSCKTKHKLYNKIRKSPTEQAIKHYKEYNNILNKLKRKLKSDYFAQKLDEHRQNIKQTWNILHQALGMKQNTMKNSPIALSINNALTTDQSIIANTFNNYFVNVGHEIQNKIPPSQRTYDLYLPPSQTNSIFIDEVSEADVVLAIKSLKTKTSSGHDNISTKLLKQTFPAILTPLTHIINTSFRSAIIPHQMKQAKVIPIHKAADPHLPENYRPISMLPAFSKVLERLMYNKLTHFLESHNLFYKHQYGFRKSHSTIHPIIHFLNQCAIANNSSPPNSTLAIFCDLSKAFDVLDHKILIHKLSNIGIRGIALKWITNYITDRTQYVNISQTNSNISRILSGVPQGSILGPLLYLIYVNDISQATDASILSFADDTTITISARSNEQLFTKANKALTEINTWFTANKLFLNLNKTQYMIITPSQKSFTTENNTLQVANHNIARTTSTKFLGIHIDQHLTWKTHISKMNSKVSKAIFAIQQVKHFLPTTALKTLYFSLIHPHLLYSIHAWGNTPSNSLNSTIRLQKKAIRIINKAKYNSHTEPLYKKSNILKLTHLYEQQIALFLNDFHHKRLPVSFNNTFQYTQDIRTRNTRSNNMFYYPTPRTKFTEKLPPHSFPKIANKYSNLLTNPSRASVKKAITDKFLSSYQSHIQCNNTHCPDCTSNQ